jgi:energy-coupling factor transporter transmembrane protein EcfT
MGALLIPLLLANLRRGEELAESMESRLYGTGPRTTLYQPHFQMLDLRAGVIASLFTLAIVLLAVL